MTDIQWVSAWEHGVQSMMGVVAVLFDCTCGAKGQYMSKGEYKCPQCGRRYRVVVDVEVALPMPAITTGAGS